MNWLALQMKDVRLDSWVSGDLNNRVLGSGMHPKMLIFYGSLDQSDLAGN